jgi:hypothetical protein
MDERQKRIGLNEAVFRTVNERIEELTTGFQLGDHPLDLVCECGNPHCVERITMMPSEYERVRSDATTFAVYPGHEEADVEEVVDRSRGYDIVRKYPGEPAKVAKETDPRS